MATRHVDGANSLQRLYGLMSDDVCSTDSEWIYDVPGHHAADEWRLLLHGAYAADGNLRLGITQSAGLRQPDSVFLPTDLRAC